MEFWMLDAYGWLADLEAAMIHRDCKKLVIMSRAGMCYFYYILVLNTSYRKQT